MERMPGNYDAWKGESPYDKRHHPQAELDPDMDRDEVAKDLEEHAEDHIFETPEEEKTYSQRIQEELKK